VRNYRFLTGLAAATLVAALAAPTRADTIGVLTDNGDVGNFLIRNLSTAAQPNLFELSFTAPTLERLTAVNGATVVTSASFSSPIIFTVTGSNSSGHITISQAVAATKTFFSNPLTGQPNPMATLNFTLNAGEIGSGPGGTNELSLSGIITSIPSKYVDISGNTYDFSNMSTINFALTTTTYYDPNGNMLPPGAGSTFYLGTTPGASATGSIGFSQASAVPEPASLAIVSVSLVGLLAYRRYGKRPVAA